MSKLLFIFAILCYYNSITWEGYMEEEVKEVEVKEEAKVNEIKFSASSLFMMLGLIAVVILVISKILINFGVFNSALYGIVGIIVYSLPLAGALLAFLQNKKPNCVVWLNLAVLALALIAYTPY